MYLKSLRTIKEHIVQEASKHSDRIEQLSREPPKPGNLSSTGFTPDFCIWVATASTSFQTRKISVSVRKGEHGCFIGNTGGAKVSKGLQCHLSQLVTMPKRSKQLTQLPWDERGMTSHSSAGAGIYTYKFTRSDNIFSTFYKNAWLQ